MSANDPKRTQIAFRLYGVAITAGGYREWSQDRTLRTAPPASTIDSQKIAASNSSVPPWSIQPSV